MPENKISEIQDNSEINDQVLGKQARKCLVSDTLTFTLSNYFATAFSFISSFVVRKVLGPMAMGLLSELILILDYCRFHHLGIINAMEREVPFYNGKQHFKRVEEIKKTTLAFIAFSAINVGAVLFIVSFFSGVHRVGLRFLAVIVMVETVVSFYEALLQSYSRFKIWSLFIIFIGFIEVTLKIIFVVNFGLNGLLFAMILTGVVSVFMYHRWGRCKVDFKAKIYFKEVVHLIKLGVPLIFFRLMYLLSISIDRIVIIAYLGRLQLGYYSIATMVSSYLILMPKFGFRTLYPKFMETFGRNENIEEIKKFLITPNKIFGSLFSVLIGLIVIGLPFLVIYFLPRFKEGIFAAQIIAVTAFFASFIYTWNFLLIALYEQKRLALLYGIGAGITFIVNIFFISVLNMKINGVALATLISQFIFTTILICYGYRYFTRKILEHLRLLAVLYLPFLWIGITMLGSRFYYPRYMSFKGDLLGVVSCEIIFLVISSPIIYFATKKEHLIALLVRNIKNYRS